MFDPHMTDAWKKIKPISDTKEMTDLFYENHTKMRFYFQETYITP